MMMMMMMPNTLMRTSPSFYIFSIDLELGDGGNLVDGTLPPPSTCRVSPSPRSPSPFAIHITNAIKPPHKNIITMTLCQSGS